MARVTTDNAVLAWLRFAAPQILTSLRIVLALYAMEFALRGQAGPAATLLLFGLVTDALDGACARLLGVVTEFGQMFDYFADYLYFVVAPTTISWTIAKPDGMPGVFVLGLPCVCAALRYARKAGGSEGQPGGIPASPGLPTLAFALYVAALALLWREQTLSQTATASLLRSGSPVLALLMTVRTRYPKLSVYPWILVPILAGLMIMPFVLTGPLATATLVLIAVYVLFATTLVATTSRSGACPGRR